MPETDSGSLVGVKPAPPAEQPKTGEAFADFFRHYRTELLRRLMYMGALKEEAEDAVSEAMKELIGRWDTIHHPLAYAQKAALNYFVKTRKRDRERIAREASPKAFSSPELDSQEQIAGWEDQEQVLRMLNSLPPTQRDVFALLVDQYSQKEIADLLGKSPEAVRQNVLAARRALRPKVEAASAGQSRLDESSPRDEV